MTPARIILDTEMSGDCDDAGAVAVLHALAGRGEAEPLGVVCSTGSPWGSPCLAAINAYYGRSGIPIGAPNGAANGGSGPQPDGETYNRHIAEHYPNALRSGGQVLDAVALYRHLLAREADQSVSIVCIGMLTCLRDLLLSPADDYSPLRGDELLRRKVKLLSVMGGRFPAGPAQRSFAADVAAARQVIAEWPTAIVFSGSELGEAVRTGPRLMTDVPPTNPVRKAYELWCGHFERQSRKEQYEQGRIYPHASCGQIPLLHAVRGLGDCFGMDSGYHHVGKDGSSRWLPPPSPTTTDEARHRRLKLIGSPARLAQVIEDLMVSAGAR